MDEVDLHAHKLELLGQMTAAILHDLQSPLTYIAGNNRHLIKKISKQLTSEPLFEDLLEVLKENETGLNQIKEILSQISGFIKNDQDTKYCLLHNIIRDSRKIVLPQTKSRISIQTKLTNENDCIKAVPSQINQVIINLLVNCIEAFENQTDPKVIISTESKDDKIIIRVEDNASGIPSDKLENIFEWYVSYKESGTGQGLAICKQIIEKHQGTITCQSSVGKGTCFTITLPRVEV